MKCEPYKSKISFMIKNELDYDETVDLKNHLHMCPVCRKEYKDYLKYYYLIDLARIEEKSASPALTINTCELQKKNSNKWIWYSAAAVLLVMILFSGIDFAPHYITENKVNVENQVITAIQNDDWQKLMTMWQDPETKEILLTTEIPVQLLEEKMARFNSEISSGEVYQFVFKEKQELISKKDYRLLSARLYQYSLYKKHIRIDTIINYLNENKLKGELS